jgi:Spy/CpxP family protein refolding chaperone
MKRGWFVLLALSLGLNAGLLYVQLRGQPEGAPAPTTSTDEQSRYGPRFHPDGTTGFIRDRVGRIGSRLDLSDTQLERMTAVSDEMMPRILAQQEIVRQAQDAVRAEYLNPLVDRESILQLQRKGSLARARLDSLVVETMIREAMLLSPEQRGRYFKMMRWKEERGHGGRMRRGRRGADR